VDNFSLTVRNQFRFQISTEILKFTKQALECHRLARDTQV
jgi:hypothetical protein